MDVVHSFENPDKTFPEQANVSRISGRCNFTIVVQKTSGVCKLKQQVEGSILYERTIIPHNMFASWLLESSQGF